MYKVKHENPFKLGYNSITTMEETENNTMMDFGILRVTKGHVEVLLEAEKEMALLLVIGEVTLKWNGEEKNIKRSSCFDEDPWVLHVPRNIEVVVEGISEETEINITKASNDVDFESKLYTPEECRSEDRGKGTLKECSTRIVRTVFDYSNAPYSNLVVGEVVDYPGKWSSYPPHHHPQPEIYYYKFYPENGYGFSQLGDSAEMVKNDDTIKILNDLSHPQVTAPGYAMYYIWVIRHIDGNPYITPVFEEEHLWTTNKDAKIWPDK
ncbi:5-deoxy-glucuronate isomerase [Clostridium sp.]|uniref:5-deoxy-glucuronate isomerase n=1 Tax=Clostridium sp. TaxID=1506 RepID=UPI003217C371